jgi:DNA polymerase-3 subunit delta
VKEKLFERVVPQLDAATLTALVAAAHTVDGIVKGVPDRQWPAAPWAALRRLVLLTVQAVQRKGPPLALTG